MRVELNAFVSRGHHRLSQRAFDVCVLETGFSFLSNTACYNAVVLYHFDILPVNRLWKHVSNAACDFEEKARHSSILALERNRSSADYLQHVQLRINHECRFMCGSVVLLRPLQEGARRS